MCAYLQDTPASGPRKRVTTLELAAMKRAGQRIVMITAYDTLFAKLVDESGVDVVLVGDSVAPLLTGEETTLGATMDQMIYHGRIVRRGLERALLVVDLPFLSYQVSPARAVANAGRILKETGAAAVKLEGGVEFAPTVARLVAAGIPVMGHLGFTPQSVHQLGGHRIQGKQAGAAERLVEDARALESAGAFSMVLELMPGKVAEQVTAGVSIPTIGIGAGVGCDGQVLVLHDMLGLNEGFKPKFLKHYAQLGATVRDAVGRYAAEVRAGEYPGPEHSHTG
ncbi:MAG: 3-methyl-2-oxobutanoate hydroxymethyltransferase [Gemmatimonadales bacterium]